MDQRDTANDIQRSRSEAGYRLLFDRHPLPMWVFDLQTLRFLAVNQAAVLAYGYSETEFLALSLPDIRPTSDIPALLDQVAGPRPVFGTPGRWRHCRRNGELIDVEIVSESVEFAGRPARLVLARDITAGLQAQAAVQASERRYRDIVETAIEGIWTIDAQALTTFVNPKMAQMLGYSAADMAGRPFTDFMDAEGVLLAHAKLERRRQGVSEQHDFCFRRQDGSALWASISTNPVLDDAGAYAGALAMVTDITERRRLAARDAARDRVLRLIATGAPLGEALDAIVLGLQASQPGLRGNLMLLDSSGTRLLHGAAPSLPDSFNQALDKLAIGPAVGSCGSAAFTGQRVVSANAVADPCYAPFLPLMAANRIVSSWSEPILSARGKVLGTLGIYHGQIHTPGEQEISSVAEAAQLAAIVIERKRADEALRESQKMEALGTLAGGIAHDFNNILGAILGNLALAGEPGSDPASAQARLEQVRQSALQARHLVQQITAFGRRQPHLTRPQPLAPLVQDTLALLQATLPASVRWIAPPWLQAGLPPGARPAAPALQVEVDANQIQQVLMNLCTNAWQAMPDGVGEIEVGLAPDQADPGTALCLAGLSPGLCAHLWVRDSGSGMDEATRLHIFEPFYTTRPVGSGSGLGLAVVHGIVSEHSGVITVDSAPGQGSTFHLYLPAQRAAGQPGHAGQRPHDPLLGAVTPDPDPDPDPDASAVARQILCVDDDPVVLLTNAGLLECLGYVVTSVDNGQQALDVLDSNPERFDLVVTDHNMPGLSGLDVARVLADRVPALPVLICSGYIDADLCRQAEAVGVRGLIRKEHTVDDLGPAVRRVLDRSHGSPAAP